MQSDKAPHIADVLMATRGQAMPQRLAAIAQRVGEYTRDEMNRGVSIAQELLRAEGSEYLAKADALDAEVERRRLRAKG